MAIRKSWCPDRGDMIWIDCNPQVERELRDVHPLVVLSPRKFNERTGIVIGFSMTTASSNETNPFAVKFKGGNGVVSYVLAHQPKSFDWRARGAKPHPSKRVPDAAFEEACATLEQIIGLGQ